MNMKRIFALALMSRLLCLPVMAMAECPFIARDIMGKTLELNNENKELVEWGSGNLEIKASGLIVYGSGSEAYLVRMRKEA